MEYFIIDNNGQQAGPFNPDQLVQKGITPETLVWKQGMADWAPAWKVDELKTVLEAVEANNANESHRQATSQQTTDQQQGFQQGQTYQQAYQQGFQQGAAINANFQQPKKKKSNHFAIKLIIGLVIFILAVFAVTNPSAEAHKEKVRTEASKAIEKAVGATDNNFFTQALRSAAKMMAGNMIDGVMDQLFEYHNYVICSKGSVEFNGKQHTVSFGILGKVYTMNADDMVKALEDSDNLQIEETESTSTSEPNITPSTSEGNSTSDNVDKNSAESNNDEEDFQTRVQQKLKDKANQALDKAADKISKKVEEKINQKLDETSDSSKIEKIIDKILEIL